MTEVSKKIKIAAALIAKDEKHVWRRCIENLVQFCNIIVIVDTGSTDGSQEYIVEVFNELNFYNYVLIQDTWISDFSYSRNIAVCRAEEELLKAEGFTNKVLTFNEFQKLRNLSWYIFVKDIDDEVINCDKLRKEIQTFNCHAYNINCPTEGGTSTHNMRAFVKFDYKIKFRYTKELHETLDNVTCDNITLGFVKDAHILIRPEGNRSKNKFKYLNDANVFYRLVIKNPYDERSVYYLAQSLRNQKLTDSCVIYYKKRYELEYGYQCERYLSILFMCYYGDYNQDEIINLLLKAIEIVPDRFEAPTEIMRQYINKKLYHNAIIYGERWYSKSFPDNRFLSVSTIDHQFHLPDLLAQCYKQIGNVFGAKKIWSSLLEENRVPSNKINKIKSLL